MNEEKIIKSIDILYEKYMVDKSFYNKMSNQEKIRRMKGILAELDLKKKMPYEDSDVEIIKDIFSFCCQHAFTIYTYDGNGNITGIQLPSGDEIHREYDLCDRITAEHYREKNGSIDNRITYHYDKNGKLISQINPNELQARGDAAKGFRYYYDSKGRNTGILSPEDQLVYSAEYDRMGNLVKEGNGDGTVDIAYDLGGRRIMVSASGKVLQKYQYDAMGNLTGLTDGNGNETAYATDLWGRCFLSSTFP